MKLAASASAASGFYPSLDPSAVNSATSTSSSSDPSALGGTLPHHHMQLWTNEANSATTSTRGGQAGRVSGTGSELPPSQPHSTHSSTHSPTTSTNSSVVSSSSSSSSSASTASTAPLKQELDGGGGSQSLLMMGDGALIGDVVGRGEQMECVHCGIFFTDPTLSLLHKGLHSESQPFRCNLCGAHCSNKYTFTTHIISVDHS